MLNYQPPHNAEMERALISLMVRCNEVIPDVAAALTADDFCVDVHRTLYRIVSEVDYPRQRIDLYSLFDTLERRKLLGSGRDEITMDVLADLCNEYATQALTQTYIDVVKRDAVLRQIHKAGTDLHMLATKPPEDVTEAVEEAHKLVDGIRYDTETSTEDVASALTQLFHAMQDGKTARAIPTGFRQLDELLDGGFRPGEMCVLAARPGVGKTTFALNMAERMCAKGFTVCVFSLEMGSIELVSRVLGSMADVSHSKIRKGDLSKDEIGKLFDVADKLRRYDLWVKDRFDTTVARLYSEARRLKKLDVVIVDYLQLITATDRKASRAEQVGDISRRLKGLAKTLDVPVIALSQLNRGSEAREDRRPRMSELRESGSLEQDADQVILMWPDAQDNNFLRVSLEKQRNGSTGEFMLQHEKQFVRFRDVDRDMGPDPFTSSVAGMSHSGVMPQGF